MTTMTAFLTATTRHAVNGFEALKDLDDNNDGIFDCNDKAWNEVKIWQDKNSLIFGRFRYSDRADRCTL